MNSYYKFLIGAFCVVMLGLYLAFKYLPPDPEPWKNTAAYFCAGFFVLYFGGLALMGMASLIQHRPEDNYPTTMKPDVDYPAYLEMDETAQGWWNQTNRKHNRP